MPRLPRQPNDTWGESLVFRFPNPVNEISARLVAGGVVVMSATALVFRQHWILFVLAYGFVARVLAGPELSPLGLLVTRVITPRLEVEPKLVPGPPKRFAQTIGAVVTTTALIGYGFGFVGFADVLLGMMVVFAFLESVLTFCVGCKIFAGLMRIGVIPQEVCEACADITKRYAPSPA